MAISLSTLLPVDGRVAVMGILNITPDSFSDGGQLYSEQGLNAENLLQRAEQMALAGVHFFDVGGESTRPGALAVSTSEELTRVIAALRLLKQHFDIPVSVDTSNPEVIHAACEEGAELINDVRALTRPGAMEAAVSSGLPVCLMHMPAEPGRMQLKADYKNVVAEVKKYLLHRVSVCAAAGIAKDSIVIDPGFGFGKTLAHNLALFRALPELAKEHLPIMVGVSRKRMIGDILGKDSSDRLSGSTALALLAAQRGAKILRVHDVAETVDTLKILTVVEGN